MNEWFRQFKQQFTDTFIELLMNGLDEEYKELCEETKP